jgi:hypothetical protein
MNGRHEAHISNSMKAVCKYKRNSKKNAKRPKQKLSKLNAKYI